MTETAATARLDAELVRRGLARSRGQARELVAAGAVLVDGTPVTKPSTPIRREDTVRLSARPERWVGRAAYKLLGALADFGPHGLTARGTRCLDVGASTGGFTQVLLEAGAEHVTALDVGHGQLVEWIAADPRVEERSGTNVRDVRPGDLGPPFDLVVADLSFISLLLVLPRVAEQVTGTGDAVLLVKPQYEVGRDRLSRTGVVTAASEWRRVLADVLAGALEVGLRPVGLEPSPIRGSTGNREYLLWVTARLGSTPSPEQAHALVEQAVESKGAP